MVIRVRPPATTSLPKTLDLDSMQATAARAIRRAVARFSAVTPSGDDITPSSDRRGSRTYTTAATTVLQRRCKPYPQNGRSVVTWNVLAGG